MTQRQTAYVHLLLLALLLLYWAASLSNLAVAPPVYEDEPWQASTGWKLATQGVFGSDMFAGYHGMEQRIYAFMPVHPILLAASLRIAGLGLFQARLETVVMGLLGLALTYALGARLFNAPVGLLASALLLLTRFTALSHYQVTGILWLDFTRIARYDAVVPVFGLASLHAYLTANSRSRPGWYLWAGLLAGLAALSHLYGVFWLVVLVSLVLWNQGGWRAGAAVLLGFALPWTPYLIYVLGDLPDWAGQTRNYAPRFDLLNTRWYLDNLLHEVNRYRLGLSLTSWPGMLRPGVWLMLIGLPMALAALGWKAIVRRDRPARVLFAPALLLPVLFALLIQLKLANYAINLAPLAALVLAWGVVASWRWSRSLAQGAWLRAGIAVLLLLVAFEGTRQIAHVQASAGSTTPYHRFIAQVRQHIPDGSRVLGLHSYWFGLSDLDYRTWYVPLVQADPIYSQPSIPIGQVLDHLAPDVILVDPRLRAYLDEPAARPGAADPGEVTAWMASRGYHVVAVVDNPTYGQMQIYWLERP
jgi:4-amino-4-deoxy-L-arabinose transferase-like glycosyltransferase